MRPALNLNLFFSYCLLLFVNPEKVSSYCSVCMYDTQWGHFMSVEIVIIDAILFRYILMLSVFESKRKYTIYRIFIFFCRSEKRNKSFSFFDNIRKKEIWPLKRLC